MGGVTTVFGIGLGFLLMIINFPCNSDMPFIPFSSFLNIKFDVKSLNLNFSNTFGVVVAGTPGAEKGAADAAEPAKGNLGGNPGGPIPAR